MILKCVLNPDFSKIIDWALLVSTFSMGLIVANYKAKRKDKKVLNSLFEYFNLYLEKQKETFVKQIKSFKKYIVSLEKLTPFKSVNYKYYIQPYEMLEYIDKTLLIQSFKLNNINEKKAIEILTVINLFKENITNFREAHNNLIRRQNEILKQWSLEMKQFHQIKIQLLSIPKLEISNIPELIELNLRYNELLKTQSSTPQIQLELCIKPLLNYFDKKYNENHLNKYSLTLLPVLSRLETLYKESLEIISIHRDFLTQITSTLEENINTLEIKKGT